MGDATMPQLELPFDTTAITLEFRKKYHHKVRLYEASLVLYEDHTFAVVVVEYSGRNLKGLELRMSARANEAYRLRNTRPLGDQYWTPDGVVSYLTDLVL